MHTKITKTLFLLSVLMSMGLSVVQSPALSQEHTSIIPLEYLEKQAHRILDQWQKQTKMSRSELRNSLEETAKALEEKNYLVDTFLSPETIERDYKLEYGNLLLLSGQYESAIEYISAGLKGEKSMEVKRNYFQMIAVACVANHDAATACKYFEMANRASIQGKINAFPDRELKDLWLGCTAFKDQMVSHRGE
ncbi:hypothetical protein V6R21_18870 [Limibacter armeniacum]|uniref:hypothetical protein n=1 Tax=Limibacter armeniacum TaxID=466084 RepID=UPI002FE4FD36